MKYNRIMTMSLTALMMAGVMLTASCSKDDYAEINTDPAKIGTPDINFLLTQAQTSFQPFDYLLWNRIKTILYHNLNMGASFFTGNEQNSKSIY